MWRRPFEESSGGKPETESLTESSTDWMISRILVFYILGVLITGMLVPYDDERLLKSTGNAAQSPYVIAMQIAGIKGLPHLVNAGVFTSAFSAGNSFLYTSSRVLYGLALRGQAPRFLAKCTKGGLPWVAVAICSCFGFLSFLNVSSSSAQAFTWLVSLSAVGSFFSWFSINLTYLGFCEWLLVTLRLSAPVLIQIQTMA
jgi:amino acid transporter